MEKKEKNSKRSAKLIVVLIALLLIACSLLGFTLAASISHSGILMSRTRRPKAPAR